MCLFLTYACFVHLGHGDMLNFSSTSVLVLSYLIFTVILENWSYFHHLIDQENEAWESELNVNDDITSNHNGRNLKSSPCALCTLFLLL